MFSAIINSSTIVVQSQAKYGSLGCKLVGIESLFKVDDSVSSKRGNLQDDIPV
jgi:hypothetical protein